MKKALFVIGTVMIITGFGILAYQDFYWTCKQFNMLMISKEKQNAFERIPTKVCHPYWFK